MSHEIYSQLFVVLPDCACNSFKDPQGHGNCEMEYLGLIGCYVDPPSSCTDLIPNGVHTYSKSQACQGILLDITEVKS